MKKVCISLLLFFACIAQLVEESDYKVTKFDSLSVTGPFRTDIFQGEEQFLQISCQIEKCLDKFVVEQEGTELFIRVADGVTKLLNVRLKLGFIKLKKISISQTSTVIAPYLHMENKAIIDMHSVANLKVGEIQAQNLILNIRDTSTAILQSGVIDDITVSIHSVSNLKAANVQAKRALITASQISKVSLTCLDFVKAAASDMSEIKIGGQPEIERSADMLSKVILVHAI